MPGVLFDLDIIETIQQAAKTRDFLLYLRDRDLWKAVVVIRKPVWAGATHVKVRQGRLEFGK